jgi:hypothetical protein
MNEYYTTNIVTHFRQIQHSLQVPFEFIKSVHLEMVDILKHFISVIFEF